MNDTANLDTLLTKQAKALGRRIRPTETLRIVMHRRVGGRQNWACVRRISPPNRYRDDVSVNGAWRFSEGFDGTRAWYLEKDGAGPQEASGRARAAQRWAGALLDHLRPLSELRRLGCTLEDCGLMSTARGHSLPAVRASMSDDFAETVFIDDRGRIAAHHMDLPEAGEDEQELELCVDEWGRHDGLVHPARSTVLDRKTGESVAEIIVTSVTWEPFLQDVFNLSAD